MCSKTVCFQKRSVSETFKPFLRYRALEIKIKQLFCLCRIWANTWSTTRRCTLSTWAWNKKLLSTRRCCREKKPGNNISQLIFNFLCDKVRWHKWTLQLDSFQDLGDWYEHQPDKEEQISLVVQILPVFTLIVVFPIFIQGANQGRDHRRDVGGEAGERCSTQEGVIHGMSGSTDRRSTTHNTAVHTHTYIYIQDLIRNTTNPVLKLQGRINFFEVFSATNTMLKQKFI